MVGVVLRGDLSIRFRLKGQENALFKVFAVDGCVPKKLARLCSGGDLEPNIRGVRMQVCSQ